MFRATAISLARMRLSCRIPPQLSHISRATSRLGTSALTRTTQATFSTGQRRWISVPAARVLESLQANRGNHNLMMVYYYEGSSVYQLDVAIPLNKIIEIRDNKVYLEYEDLCFSEFLKQKLEFVSQGNPKSLCLNIAELYDDGNIWYMNHEEEDESETVIEAEVGTLTDWKENHGRPYQEGKHLLTEKFSDGTIVRLCEGNYISWNST